jgi:hypothetical protein
VAPWSWLRPYSATTSPIPSARRTPPARLARTSGTPPSASIPETAGGPSNWNRSLWRSTRSTGNPCAERTGSRPSRLDPSGGVARGPAGLYSRERAARAPQRPKSHPNIAIDLIASLHPPFRASMPEKIIDQQHVFGIGS